MGLIFAIAMYVWVACFVSYIFATVAMVANPLQILRHKQDPLILQFCVGEISLALDIDKFKNQILIYSIEKETVNSA